MKIEDFLVPSEITVFETMSVINKNKKGIVFVCQEAKLIGTLTDGDIRRFILGGGNLGERAGFIANKQFIYLKISSKELAENMMDKYCVSAVPVVNDRCEITSIYFDDGIRVDRDAAERQIDIPLVIMAGGKGSRLKPFTDILPKPLIPIGEKTITEHIIDKFIPFGCREIYLIVNYKKEFIKAYFQEEKYSSLIHLVEEPSYLGTGGGIRLLEDKISTTFFVSNCDILLDVDYSDILAYHRRESNTITLVSAKKKFTIPYGTIVADAENNIKDIIEKPSHDYLVNTGVYILEPEVINLIPEGVFIHITQIISDCIAQRKKVGTYIIEDESWMDMGQMDELEKMKKRFEK